MTELTIPWLSLELLLTLLGALYVSVVNDRDRRTQHASVFFASATLACALGAWLELAHLETHVAVDPWDIAGRWVGQPVLTIDLLSAPLMPIAALLHLATAVVTLRTKLPRYSFCGSLISETCLLGALATRHPWLIIAFVVAGTLPPLVEMWARNGSARFYAVHMAAFSLLLIAGQWLVDFSADSRAEACGTALLLAAILIRTGCIPCHLWIGELVEQATFSTALLFLTRMVGAYVAVRLLLPVAPPWALRTLVILSAITALYSAGMTLVQRDARRFFGYLFLSQSSLVLVGVETATPVALTGGLSTWLSVMLAMGGFGLVLRAVEARTGSLSLTTYHGLYEHFPLLANFFLLAGLASVGFPGTFGFIGAELLVEGALQSNPLVALAVIAAAALSGIAILQAYFKVFTGQRHMATVSLGGKPAERVTVVIVTLIILAGGVFPQPGIVSRFHAAETLLARRRQSQLAPTPSDPITARSPTAQRFSFTARVAPTGPSGLAGTEGN